MKKMTPLWPLRLIKHSVLSAQTYRIAGRMKQSFMEKSSSRGDPDATLKPQASYQVWAESRKTGHHSSARCLKRNPAMLNIFLDITVH